jgi:hypothetical protein
MAVLRFDCHRIHQMPRVNEDLLGGQILIVLNSVHLLRFGHDFIVCNNSIFDKSSLDD